MFLNPEHGANYGFLQIARIDGLEIYRPAGHPASPRLQGEGSMISSLEICTKPSAAHSLPTPNIIAEKTPGVEPW
jgi:hypothetical protein